LYGLDAPKSWSPPFLDYWGNEIEIASRITSEQLYDFIIASKGPDGRYGTEDDIVVPYGRKLPESKIIKGR